jgi:hypothetical protein
MYSISEKLIFFFLDFENSTVHTLCQAMNLWKKISAALSLPIYFHPPIDEG